MESYLSAAEEIIDVLKKGKLISSWIDLNSGSEMAFIQHSGSCEGSDALLSFIVQLCIDPHYRSLQGFCELFDKEWNFYRYIIT